MSCGKSKAVGGNRWFSLDLLAIPLAIERLVNRFYHATTSFKGSYIIHGWGGIRTRGTVTRTPDFESCVGEPG
jgi:hypothetical protein